MYVPGNCAFSVFPFLELNVITVETPHIVLTVGHETLKLYTETNTSKKDIYSVGEKDM